MRVLLVPLPNIKSAYESKNLQHFVAVRMLSLSNQYLFYNNLPELHSWGEKYFCLGRLEIQTLLSQGALSLSFIVKQQQ